MSKLRGKEQHLASQLPCPDLPLDSQGMLSHFMGQLLSSCPFSSSIHSPHLCICSLRSFFFLPTYLFLLHLGPRRTIEKICDFLGKKLEPGELDMVLMYSSFQAMKENKMLNFSLIRKDTVPNGLLLMLKGTTGDWKNHLTVHQAEAFDKVF